MSAVDWLRERLSDRTLFDHSCQPPERLSTHIPPDYLRRCFMPESLPDTLRQTPYTVAYRLALRWLAQCLGCDPTEEAILHARAERSFEEDVQLLAEDARLGPACALSSADERVYSPTEWAALVQRPVAELVAVEPLAEKLLPHCTSWDELRTLLAQALAEAVGRGAVALVSDFPRRTSLAIQPIDGATADRSFYEVRAELDAGLFEQLHHRRLLYALFWIALEVAAELTIPLQLVLPRHPARDPHADDPTYLRTVLDEPRYQHVPIVLVSSLRLHPHAIALARQYLQVLLDPGPSFLAYPGLASSTIRELVTSVPTLKLLASTGGYFLPEHQRFVARVWRLALVEALGSLVEDGLLTLAEAEMDAMLILAGNAQRTYRFPR
jgi:hypothetical protein